MVNGSMVKIGRRGVATNILGANIFRRVRLFLRIIVEDIFH